jgi:hypothetical protein
MKAAEVKPGLLVRRIGSQTASGTATSASPVKDTIHAKGTARVGVTLSGIALLHGKPRGVLVQWSNASNSELIAVHRLEVLGDAPVPEVPIEKIKLSPGRQGHLRYQLYFAFPGVATPHIVRTKRRYNKRKLAHQAHQQRHQLSLFES